MTTDTTELFSQAEQEYRETFDADIELLELLVHTDGETGTFYTPSGEFYNFAYVRDFNEYIALEDEEATGFFEEFAQGALASQGIPAEAFRDDAAGFYLGTLATRSDMVGGKCGRGWQPGPGGKCIRGKGGGKLKQGGLGRKAAIAGGLAAGAAALGGAALLGGTKAGRAAVGKAQGELTKVGRNSKAAMVMSPGTLAGARVGAIGSAAKDLGSGIVGGAKEIGGNIKAGAGKAKDKATELAGKAKAAGQEAVSNVKKAVKGAKDKATTAAASAVTGVKVKKEEDEKK